MCLMHLRKVEFLAMKMPSWLSQYMGIKEGGDVLCSLRSEQSHIISHVVADMAQYSYLVL